MTQFANHEKEINDHNVGVFVIGHGTPKDIEWFYSKNETSLEIFVASNRDAYRVTEMISSIKHFLSFRTIGFMKKAHHDGFRQTSLKGNPWQLGGVLMISVAGQLMYQHRSQQPGDHADINDILNVLK